MTPPSRRRCRRSATAGADSPTRRPSSASVTRASAWSSSSSRRLTVSSSASSAFRPFGLSFEVIYRKPPSLSSVIVADHQALCPVTMPRGHRTPPPHLYFVVSSLFHYLGPSFAVLLFVRVPVLGVAWL